MNLKVWRQSGRLSVANVFTTVGKGQNTGRLTGGVTTTNNQGAWGTGAGTAAVTDTTLFTEASEARVTATLTQQLVNVANDTFQMVYTLVANGTKTITNAGVFDAATVGNLFVKGDHAGIPLLINDSIAYTFKLTFA